MLASSHASRELSTASLTVVSSAFSWVIEPKEVSVFGEELGDGDVSLLGGHGFGVSTGSLCCFVSGHPPSLAVKTVFIQAF